VCIPVAVRIDSRRALLMAETVVRNIGAKEVRISEDAAVGWIGREYAGRVRLQSMKQGYEVASLSEASTAIQSFSAVPEVGSPLLSWIEASSRAGNDDGEGCCRARRRLQRLTRHLRMQMWMAPVTLSPGRRRRNVTPSPGDVTVNPLMKVKGTRDNGTGPASSVSPLQGPQIGLRATALRARSVIDTCSGAISETRGQVVGAMAMVCAGGFRS
jgi:hypothetical protein